MLRDLGMSLPLYCSIVLLHNMLYNIRRRIGGESAHPRLDGREENEASTVTENQELIPVLNGAEDSQELGEIVEGEGEILLCTNVQDWQLASATSCRRTTTRHATR